ncbi:MAG: prepilin-type N-terminal cleavage/methylation domain-containing protein [bacterium]
MNIKGFTLVELLVVIVLVSIVASMSLVALNPASIFARSRDSKRFADMAFLMNAFERYNIDNGSYPDSADIMRVSSSLPQGQTGPLQSATSGWIVGDMSKLISRLSTDPKNEDFLVYRYKRVGSAYELDCYLEYYVEKSQTDGGNNPGRFEVGNDMNILP